MTQVNLTARCAPIAIAAILALGSTPGIAQEAQIPPATAPTAAVPAPSPTFQSPPIMQSPVDPAPQATPTAATSPRYVSTPTVQNVPDPEPVETTEKNDPAPTAARSTTERAAAPAAPRAETSSVRQSSPTASVSVGRESNAVETTEPENYASIPEYNPTVALPEEPAPEIADSGSENGLIGLLAAALIGLIPIGLAIAAVVWWRRRSRPVAEAPRPTAQLAGTRAKSPPVAPAPEPVRATPARDPVFTRTDIVRPPMAPLAPAGAALGGVALAERVGSQEARQSERSYNEPEVPSDDVRNPQEEGASSTIAKPIWNDRPSNRAVTLPAHAPADPTQRRALIERMVDAAPDRANPFTSRKARAKRARLILASLGRDFGSAKPAFG